MKRTADPPDRNLGVPRPSGPSVGQVLVLALLVVLLLVLASVASIVPVAVPVVGAFLIVNLLIGWLLYRSTHDR